MRLSIFGMGYVGVVSGACLLRDGHTVMGIDPVRGKVDDLNKGLSPISEPGVAEMLKAGHYEKRLSASTDPKDGVDGIDMIWICVGTPSSEDGSVNLSYVEATIEQIGSILRTSDSRPLIVLRSTVPPRTTRDLIPLLEKASALKVGNDIHLCFHPEFLREGTAVEDFDVPPTIVIGEADAGAGERLVEIYEKYDAPLFRIALEEAELVKYCANVYHALKITFANEIGAIAKSFGVDARKVADVYCADKKLNISEKYLRPGFAFGGSCLPKDLRAINRLAAMQSVPVPMLNGIQESNRVQIEKLVSRILEYHPKTVGIVGIAFKTDTDDMRESPFVAVAKRLIGEGIKIQIYDPNVHPERLVGSNKEAVKRSLGHLESLMVDSTDELGVSDIILLNHSIIDEVQINHWIEKGISIIDVSDTGLKRDHLGGYEGIAW